MTRVAIAGTGGLACSIARCIHEETSHPFIMLSRAPRPHLSEKGFQVVVVDYDDQDVLEFALKGIQVVISTIPGAVQFRLIDAAMRVGVQRYAPAEFEGPSSLRPVDALDGSKTAVLNYLRQNSNRMNWTCFVCGILYERFAPGGMRASNIGLSTRISGQGEYLVNLEDMTAEVPFTNVSGQVVSLCLTSATDVGRFIVKSLEMRTWPPELTMYGERLTIQELISISETVRGKYFYPGVIWHNYQSLQRELSSARTAGDSARYNRLLYLVATQEGRYDFDGPVLNARYPDIIPTKFRPWLELQWSDQARILPSIGVSFS